jgi:hypothetical protein
METMMMTTTTISKAAQGTSAVTTIHADELQPGDVFMDDGGTTTRSPASTGATAGPGPSLATTPGGPSPWVTT